MASAYSLLHNYQQELYSPNLELINTALQFKQQSLNANRQKLQTMYDQYSFLDVAKEEDQEYLENRLQSVKSVMDQYSSLDLSSSNLTGQLVNNMSQVVDDSVKNAVISTKIYQAEQGAWQKLREEKPDKYSDVNYAYARRSPNQWLTDGKTGSVYKGGGGVIEYTDVQGKLSKEIPAIAESIKAEWVELADGGGYFRDVVTKERVSRGQLETAMDGLLNEQDRRQLQINAWGQYDQMSDQQLEAEYSNHFAPKVQAIQDEIVSLERTIQTTKDPQIKGQRQELLDFYRDQLSAYEANSFTNVAQNYGREAAYATLYDNKFRSNYLDTYSYTDRVTKIDTYENDVQQRNYEFKLEEFAYDKTQDAINNQFKSEELRIKEMGAAGTKPGDPNYVASIPGTHFDGKTVALPYEERGSMIAEVQKQNRDLVNQAKTVFGVTSDADLRDLSKVFNEGFAGKEFIEFKGKKINVQENLDLLLQYQNRILTTSPVEKEATGRYNEAISKSLSNLRELAQGGNPDWSPESVPEFSFYFRKNEETGIMEKKNLGDSNKSNVYQYLLSKPSLSEEEQFTLDVYHKTHLLMDPNLSETQRAFILKEFQTNQLSQVSNADLKYFPTDLAEYRRLGNQASGKDNPLNMETEVTSTPRASQAAKPVDQRIDRTPFVRPKSTVWFGDFYLSDITAKDAEYYDKNGKEVSIAAPSKIIEDGIKLYEEVLESEYKNQYLEPSLSPRIFSAVTSGYNTLATLVGLPEGSKMPITLLRVLDEKTQQPTGKVRWEYKTKIEGKEVRINSKPEEELTEDDLRSSGVVDYGPVSRLKYDATWGENAPKIDLGNNTYDENIIEKNQQLFGGELKLDFLTNTPYLILDEAQKWGGQEFRQNINSQITAFESGAFGFKMESVNGYWKVAIYNGTGDRLDAFDLNPESRISGLTNEEVAQIHDRGQYYVDQTMYLYLKKQIDKAQQMYLRQAENTMQRSTLGQ